MVPIYRLLVRSALPYVVNGFSCVFCWSVVVPADAVKVISNFGITVSLEAVHIIPYDTIHDVMFGVFGVSRSPSVVGRRCGGGCCCS